MYTVFFLYCRACGQIFCNDCSSHRIVLTRLGYKNQERVCDRCYTKYRDEAKKRAADGSKVLSEVFLACILDKRE